MDRDKALGIALGQIEKQFGKGAVMRMGEEAKEKIASVPTGALSLDIALGIGGLPRGRIVEIYGPESSGKCLTADTFVWTDRGLETIAEVFARCGQPASCTSRITDVADLGIRAVNERGELEPVAALTHNNRRPVLALRLQSGRTVTVTANHPLRVVNERGFIVWRTAGTITTGDTVVSAAFGAQEAAEGDGLDEDTAVLLGYLVAEGSLSNRSAVRFTNWDPEVGVEFTGLVRDLFGVETVCYDGKEYAVHDTGLRSELAERYGLDYVNAAGKSVPACVRTGGHKAQRAFLSALFEGDGWIDPTSTVGLGTASEQLAREVQLLLYGLGVPATVSSTFNRTYERDDWTVTINPSVVHRFLDEIGFRSARRAAQVERCFRRSPRDPQFENVPHLAGLIRDLRDDVGGDREFDRIARDLLRGDVDLSCSRQRLRQLLDWVDRRGSLPPAGSAIVAYLREVVRFRYTYERVVAVQDAGVQPTFDLMLPATHSFIANGVLSHNTTVALHAVAEAQKLGGIAAFIDAEHALDPTYAAALGVDVENLLVSQPDTGEQALEITDMLVRSGAVDIVVIDSVAALTPRAEIEGEMGDTHVGLQARLMSQALRKLAGTLHRSKTTAVFINQLREKIGVLFGSPETTPGGRALKFYSSVRLDVRRIESLKDGTDNIGNRVRVKVVKNKCLASGTKVFDPAEGVTRTIEDVVERGEGAEVWAVDKQGRMHRAPIRSRFIQGVQDVIPVTLRDGTTLRVTRDHQILTEEGWREAGTLSVGDRVARPRRAGGFGDERPVAVDHARMLGYLIGDGYVGGKTPIAFINAAEILQQDAVAIAEGLGCKTSRSKDDLYTSFSHRPGEQNGLLHLARWAGIYGHLAWEKRIPASFFAPNVCEEVVANLLFGIFESDGWVSREQTGALRVGFTTTSEQLAHQLHWLLLRWGIVGAVRKYEPRAQRSVIAGRAVYHRRPGWEVRVSGMDNVERFARAVPMWGPRGCRLAECLADPRLRKHRGSQQVYLPEAVVEPVLAHLRQRGVTPGVAAALIGAGAVDPRGGLRQVLGARRLRRDRVQALADALDDQFLRDILADELWYGTITAIGAVEQAETYDVEVESLHNLVADDVVVHNCAPPFRQAEFDILFGEGISKEGSVLDLAVEHGVVRKSGAWFTYEGEQLGQGREKARTFLREHDDVAAEIHKKVLERAGLVPTDVVGEDQGGEDAEPPPGALM